MLRRFIIFLSALILWISGEPLWSLVRMYTLVLFFLYVVLPLLWHYSVSVQTHLIFLPYFNYGRLRFSYHWSTPQDHGVKGGHNFRLSTTDDCNIGLWHILPHSLIGHVEDTDTERENSLKSGKAIVVYMHGNSGSRAGSHRVELYNLLQSLDCHVVCFDYRGYADSTPVQPCERGVCADATSVFKWVYDRRGKSPVYIWGHSLGTGVASHVVGEICQRGSTLPIPDGLILESPFNNLQDEIRFHPMTWIYRRMPFFDFLFLEPLRRNNLEFASDAWIKLIHIPVMILHAKDDMIIPFELGHKLYLEGQRHRPEGAPPITFFEFSEERGCGHKYICRVPELKSIISEFFDRCTTATWDEDSRTPHFQGGEVEM